MIHILTIKINIKFTIFGMLSIEKREDTSVPHAVIFEGCLYVKFSESTDSAIYVQTKLSVSDYISILMENFSNNLYLIAYV